MENKTDIIIIGAGACGLFAARELSKKGSKVILLEAREKTGGRIRIVTGKFSRSLDAGPEFIHGNMPITKKLFNEAGANFYQQQGKFYHSKNGTISISENLFEGWERVIIALKSLKQDMTLNEFLLKYFADEKDKDLRKDMIQLTDGFDAADANRISVFAIREELENGSIENSYEADGGYKILVEHLTYDCTNKGCHVQLNSEVTEISWQQDHVRVKCTNGKTLEAKQVLVTVSLGILLTNKNEKGHIEFIPPIPEKIAAAKKMGFGPVIKVNMEFRNTFWNDEDFKKVATQLPELRFLNNGSEFPVWWTKTPEEPFLVGWVGGSFAEKLKNLSDEELFEKAILSLSNIMLTSEKIVRDQLVAYSVSNWGADAYTKGAYSYETPQSAEAKRILWEPLANKVFFAGEALGKHSGTVEAAFESAEQVIQEMMNR